MNDQMRTFLAASIKHGFWILCGTVAVVCLGAWLYVTSSLRSDIKNNRTAIEGEFSKAQEIQRRGVETHGETIHPNEVTRENVDQLLTDVNQSVQAAWKLQYERQGDIFVWPDSLEPTFLAKVQDMRPIEAKVEFPTPTARELSIQYRTDYKNFMINELPKLADTIGAVWDPQQGRPGSVGGADGGGRGSALLSGRGSRSGATADEAELRRERAVVDWIASSQSELLQSRFAWTQDEAPITTLDMLYAQEDFWVLTSVFQIISETNGDADARHNAAVKRIEYIKLGREALSPAGRLAGGGTMGGSSSASSSSSGYGSSSPPGGSSSYGSAPPGGSSSYGSFPSSASSGPSPSGSSVPSSQGSAAPGTQGLSGPSSLPASGSGVPGGQLDPAEGRYVDKNYMPLPAQRLRAAIRTDSPKPDDAYLRVAKRMPIRLGMVIDQRKLPALLAACANAPLTLEVRQVRLNPGSGSSSGTSGGSGSGYSGGNSSYSGSGFTGDSRGGAGFSGASSSGSPSSSSSSGSGAESSDRNLGSFAVQVEVYGIVYIYNPAADLEKLQVGQGSGAVAATRSAAPAQSPVPKPPAATAGVRVP